jgi:hypothetical protein
MIILKDFYKSDVYRFDIEYISDHSIDFTITNVISWDVTTINITKEELKGLGNFINQFLSNDEEIKE